jgi:exonuclease VII large subunit
MSQAFVLGVNRIVYRIREEKTFLDTSFNRMRTAFEHSITHTANFISSKEKQLQYSNPEEQLKRGYSIVRLRDKIIKTIKTLQKGDPVVITVCDGSAEAEITSIK